MKETEKVQLTPTSPYRYYIIKALKILAIFIIFLSLAPRVRCLYEDQKGKFDWRKQFIGIPKFVHFDSDRSTILMATESDVLASIRARDGQILWRKLMVPECKLSHMSIIRSPQTDSGNYLIRTSCITRDGTNQTQFWMAESGLLASDRQYKKAFESEESESILTDRGNLQEDGKRHFSLSLGETLQLSADGKISSILGDVPQWTRDESLASIVAFEMVHLPKEERDQFGLRKRIVVVTDYGTIFGIDSLTGEIIWEMFDQQLATKNLEHGPKAKLVILNNSDESDHRAIILNSMGYSVIIDPITGELIEKNKIDANIKQIALTEIFSHELGRAVIVLDVKNRVHIYPYNLENEVKDNLQKYYLTVVNTKPKILEGYAFIEESNTIKPKIIWTFPISDSEQIINIQMKRIDEEVHSPARVLGDRGILYKYVNPNLIAVMTKRSHGTLCNPEYNLVVYLIDGVTGALVHSVYHPRSQEPANMVHSENWLVYSYYNAKYRRTEISSMELYEGASPANSSAFSSISRSIIKPQQIEQKTFIFPSGISGMCDTVTLRGMTNKHLIVALPSGGLLEIPKIFLDPRRPIIMTMDHREEGLIPYAPELPIPSESIINYDQSLVRIKGLSTSPAMLESTSLVFAYGLDLFFTRVTPSKTFDILKDDFDHVLITGVLVLLIVGSYISKLLAQRKALHAAWK